MGTPCIGRASLVVGHRRVGYGPRMALDPVRYRGTSMDPAHTSFIADVNAELALLAGLTGTVQETVLDITTADLVTAGPNEDIPFNLPTALDALILDVVIRLVTPFTGGGASSVAVVIGHDLGGVGILEYIDAANVFSAVSSPGFVGRALADKGSEFVNTQSSVLAGGENINFRLFSDVNVNTLTAGRLVVHVFFREIAAPV